MLEVWFSASPASLPAGVEAGGLKSVDPELWKEMLDLVNCKVLSIVESEHVDAYLLSESSMFIFPHKLILKTCGTTTLLCGLPKILDIAATLSGIREPESGRPRLRIECSTVGKTSSFRIASEARIAAGGTKSNPWTGCSWAAVPT